MNEVVRHRQREIAADRPGGRIRGIRRAHCRSDDRDRRLTLEYERERRCRGDELDELAEERLLLVLGVVLLRELAINSQELCRAQLEPALLETLEDLAGELAPDSVRLDQNEGRLRS